MALLWWFAETSVVASALAFIAWALGRSRKLQLGAGARHLLWVVVLIKLLTPPVLWWPKIESPSPLEPTSPVVAIAASPKIGEFASAAPDRFDLDWDGLDSRPMRHLEPETGNMPSAALARESSAMPGLAPPQFPRPQSVRDSQLKTIQQIVTRHWVAVLVGLWAVGALVMAVRQTVRLIRFASRMKTGHEAPQWMKEDVNRIARSMRLRAPRAIVLSGTCVPMVWCLGRPTLVVPEALQTGLGVDGWRGVLTHELAHLKRSDHWVARLDLVASVIWWWSPLYRMTRTRIHEFAELACDAWVVRVGPDLAERRRYAEALVEVCEQLSNAHAGMVLGVGVSGGARSLERRLHMILRESNPNPTAGRWAVVALLLMLLTLPGWAPPAQAPSPKPKPPQSAKPSDPLIVKESAKTDSRNLLPPASDDPLPTPVLKPAPNNENPFDPLVASPAQPLAEDGGKSKPDSAEPIPSTPVADPTLTLPPPTADPFHLDPSGQTPKLVPAPAAGDPRSRESDRLESELYGVRNRAALVRDMTALITVWSERRERNGATDTRTVTASTEDYSLDNKGNGRVERLRTVTESNSQIRHPIERVRWVEANAGPEQFAHASISNGQTLQITSESVFRRTNAGPQNWVTQPEVYFLGYWAGSECPSARFKPVTKTTTRETADGKKLIRQTLEYRHSGWNLPMKFDIWVSPELGYAPVRIEYQGEDPTAAMALSSGSARSIRTTGSLTTVRVRFRDFEKRGELHFPKRIESITDQIAATGAIISRVRTRVVVDDLKINQGLVQSSFLPSKLSGPESFDQEGDGPGRTPLVRLGDRFSNYQLPPNTPEQIRRFEKAVAASPFGPPCNEQIATSNQPPQEQPSAPETASPNRLPSPVETSETPEPTVSPNPPTVIRELDRTPDSALSPSTGTTNSHQFAIAELKDGLDLMKVRLSGKQAEVKAAKGRVGICVLVADSQQRLANSNTISKSELSKAVGELTIAKAELEQKEAQLQEAELLIRQAERKIDHELKRLKRAIDTARKRVEDIQRSNGKQQTPAESEAKAELQSLLDELESAGGSAAKPD